MTVAAKTSAGWADKRTPEEIAELRETVRRRLVLELGERWVETDPCVLDTYSWQYIAEAATGSQYMPRALAIALPADAEQVAAVVRLCNELGVQYKAMSTGFGMWNSPIEPDKVVQIDLRRLDRIIKIDAKNMYAIVEPYVTGNQLQTEAMKLGLNTHIAGCGAQCSVLASATSMMGQGLDGVSMGFSNRNLLGFEWVMPGGEIVRVGSFGDAGDYFAGDGPGPSVRGVIRGFAGALGGLGVFTRCAVKLYPWSGPKQLDLEGGSPNFFARIPRHHTAAVVVVKDWKSLAELGYRIGEAEIADYLGRNAPSLMAGVLTVDNAEAAEVYKIPMLHELYYALVVVMTAASTEEMNYKRSALREIVRGLGGGALSNDFSPAGIQDFLRFLKVVSARLGTRAFLRSMPSFLGLVLRDARRYGMAKAPMALTSLLYQSLLRSGMNMRGVFRFAGTFWTAMGSLVTWDNAIRGARVGAQIKRKYIDQGVIVDDGGDNAWGGLYEGGTFSHLEELAMYDQTDPEAGDRVAEYVAETNLACVDYHCGDSLNAVGPPFHRMFSPACMDYDKYTYRIKTTFDPQNAADATMFTDPAFAPDARLEARMQAVLADRAKVSIDTSHAGAPVRVLAPLH
ncbi:MAG: FAD-binding oxidoreductase [Candidatus Schekmanbacteria bacterium]|nr:FAD-binding oxidoreductase [Candidatus Schekmanbacteria bacterium]